MSGVCVCVGGEHAHMCMHAKKGQMLALAVILQVPFILCLRQSLTGHELTDLARLKFSIWLYIRSTESLSMCHHALLFHTLFIYFN